MEFIDKQEVDRHAQEVWRRCESSPDFANNMMHRGQESQNAESAIAYCNSVETPMQTECSPTLFEFEPVERQNVAAGLDGGIITSNAGGLPLAQLYRRLGLIRRMNWQRFNRLMAFYPLPKPVIHQSWHSVAAGPQVTFQKCPVRYLRTPESVGGESQ